jgi:hypothetical protein
MHGKDSLAIIPGCGNRLKGVRIGPMPKKPGYEMIGAGMAPAVRAKIPIRITTPRTYDSAPSPGGILCVAG